jgi:hypothetical protein
MSPLYDFECEACGKKKEVLCKVDEGIVCSVCLKPMKRLCNCTNFKLVYHNRTDMCDWAGNTSMYWSEVKKQRAEGKNVKGAGE